MAHLLIYRIDELPDLTIDKYTALHGGNVRDKVLEAQNNLIFFLNEISKTSEGKGLIASLRYIFNSQEAGRSKTLSIYLILNNHTELSNDELSEIIRNSPITEFYSIRRIQNEDEITEVSGKDNSGYSIAEIIKQEVVLNSQTPDSLLPVYYFTQPPEPNDENYMTFLDRQLIAFNVPAIIDITIKPTTIKKEEFNAFKKIYDYLDEIKNKRYFKDNNRDRNLETVKDIYDDIYPSMEFEDWFECSIRVMAEKKKYASLIASSLAIQAIINNKFRVLTLSSDDEEYQKSFEAFTEIRPCHDLFWKEIWDYKIPETEKSSGKTLKSLRAIKRFSRIWNTEEIAPFFRIMIPGYEILQSIRKETDARINTQGKTIGIGREWFRADRSIEVSLENLKKHMFVSGVSGSGKTTAILNLLIQLWGDLGIPFLIIEPAKTEYRILKVLKESKQPNAKKLAKDLQIYTLGNETISPFRFNPFEFPNNISLNEHISSIESCFRGAIPMFNPLPAILAESLENIYDQLGWMGTDTGGTDLEIPTMLDLFNELEEVFLNKEYDSEVKGNLKSAIEVRIGQLLRRSIGPMFNAKRSFPDINHLMQAPVVLEMDYLNEDQANLMTMFILASIREHIRASRQLGSSLQHVIVLEEAHNIVGKVSEQVSTEDNANPKIEATKYLSRFLAEVRALGEGLVVADQLPSAMAPEVIKNTNVKLIHRIVAADDREEIGYTMLLEQEMYEDMARIPPGESYLFMEGMYKPIKVKEINVPKVYDLKDKFSPSHLEIKEIISSESWYTSILINKVNEVIGNVKNFYKDSLLRYTKIREMIIFSFSDTNLISKLTKDEYIFIHKELSNTINTLKKTWKKLYYSEYQKTLKMLTIGNDDISTHIEENIEDLVSKIDQNMKAVIDDLESKLEIIDEYKSVI